NTTFEEVCYLLWHGELPNRGQLAQLKRRLAEERPLPPRLLDLLRQLPHDTHPMAALRTAVSALASFDPEAETSSPEANYRKALRITAKMITITAAFARLRSGGEPVEPRPDLGHAANLLYLLKGEEPDELSARIVDTALTLHAEHGMNASTFAARVTIATLSDIYSAICSAIGTLKGPLHGGANEQVMEMLRSIGEPAHAESWVRAALGRGEKVMGFGHRVYRTLDPRAPILKRLAEELAARGGHAWLEISERVQAVMREEMDRRGKPIYPNVDFFSASVYYTLGIPTDLFTNVFACARAAGWTAHVMEQLQDNRLIRPDSDYIGPLNKKVVPIEERM
ncbi:MAG: citrate synthase, partial [Gemmatimonadetes bacterium]|nr:citrate synthase [Gemmatimonadota bacterium]